MDAPAALRNLARVYLRTLGRGISPGAGTSDRPVYRRGVHRAEDGELGHPELASRDLALLVTQLRAIERQM